MALILGEKQVHVGSGDDFMDVNVAVGEGQFVAVVVLEGAEQAGLGGDGGVALEMVDKTLNKGSIT